MNLQSRTGNTTNPLVKSGYRPADGLLLPPRADQLYSIDVYWIVVVQGSYAKEHTLGGAAQSADRHWRLFGAMVLALFFFFPRPAAHVSFVPISSATTCCFARKSQV